MSYSDLVGVLGSIRPTNKGTGSIEIRDIMIVGFALNQFLVAIIAAAFVFLALQQMKPRSSIMVPKLLVSAENKITAPFVDATGAHAAVGKVGWKANVEQDVSEAGCFLVPSIESCPVEYDLLSLVKGKDEVELYFGDYTSEQREDMQKSSKNSKNGFEASQGICSPENRPKTLIEFPLLRA